MEMVPKKLATVVVLFHPGEGLIGRMRSYAAVDMLMAWCNSPLPATLKDELSQAFPQLILLNETGTNEGIGKALNGAARMALNHDCHYLLTMDQDSDFGNQFPLFLNQAFSIFGSRDSAALVGPQYGGKAVARPGDEQTSLLITSGCLHNLDWWQKVGGYKEDWFIDEVDHEFGYRIQQAGGQLWQANKVVIGHTLGSNVQVRSHRRTVYGPMRSYYSLRNYLQLRETYGKDFPRDFAFRNRFMYRQYRNNLLYGGQFFKTALALWRAWRDQRQQRFGKRY